MDFPKRFNSYLVQDFLNKGTSCSIVLALNEKDNELYACKIFDRKEITKLNLFGRLEQELRVVQNIKHSGIVEVKEVLYFENYIVMVMPFYPFGTLHDKILDEGPLVWQSALKWLQSLAVSLSYLHSKNIAHRDIKLTNIMISPNQTPILIDFGLCYEIVQTQENLRTTVCGTLEYMAPEVLVGQPYDPLKVDVWALGVCFYSMIFGQFPWNGTDKQIAKGIISADPYIPPCTPYATIKLVKMMLAKNPEQRSSIFEVLNEVDNALSFTRAYTKTAMVNNKLPIKPKVGPKKVMTLLKF
ncbi:CAMK family protein kinase [Trichomonas vaginalis G3]|uniref:CAMK family protein kinase n=1 Tax=Trichomonas vaginalis (strain ATCC PRA-98 / G3) TaxID=412133 RepID=A2D8Q5_TRIV3|nr:protein kinase protein [Trichomonas vaginalis G3]EAY23304.1 CAMK family protein kinase [Trichomonas vaginalis G3]KAI5534043.1 protein kinase protein [Trichomonas vaginalis G3]|eukprot:XP_001584290.1 CAMK family protein kinase [Trichomonas vaginalis G3]